LSAWAVVVAAGEGTRFGRSKAFVGLAGIPMVGHSLITFAKVPAIEGVVLVVAGSQLEEGRSLAQATVPAITVEVVAGGATRQASVRAGLAVVPAGVAHVIVHDAARPLVTTALAEAALAALADAAGAVVAIPAHDTLKREQNGAIVETVPRDGLWRAQTPQAFRADALRRAHEHATADDATDDAALLERAGERVVIVPGDERNLKVTAPEDLTIAEALLAARGGF
jgi:2-C-methyl-D-erythritol 4-phosphate cytidylyltransferase